MFINQKELDTLVGAQMVGLMEALHITPEDAAGIESILRYYAEDALHTLDEGKTLAEKIGPSIWLDLHYRAKVADKERKPYLYSNFLTNLMDSHPCLDCRGHMRGHIQKYPLELYPSAFAHSVAFHNAVNEMLGKPQISYEMADKLYELDCDSCSFRALGKSRSHNVSPTQNARPRSKLLHAQQRANNQGTSTPVNNRIRAPNSTEVHSYNRSHAHYGSSGRAI